MKNEFYNLLAPFYAALNGEVDYMGMAEFIHGQLASRSGEKAHSVLDLGCGSGNVTLPLLSLGYDMTGVDASADMLAEAREREGGEQVLWLYQDMRSFELYGTVDAIVCTLDGINHLTKKEDVAACFSLVHNYLEPNGLFLFDVNTPHKFQTVYGTNSYILEDDGVFCGWQNRYTPKTGLCRFDITLFEEQADGSYLRADASLKEKVYTEKVLRTLLRDTGFLLLDVYDGYTKQKPNDKTDRLVFIAQAVK